MSAGPGVLNKMVVLDVDGYVAGSYCTKYLAGAGAEVIKIEGPGQGNRARMEGPFRDKVPSTETSALFLYLNTGKKGITLNLQSRTGVEIFRQLVKDADVLVHDSEPGRMEALGLDYAALEALNPALVMTSIFGFGSTGPYRHYNATSMTHYAMGGYMYITGDPEGPPLQGPGPQPEYEAGLHGAVGTMAALWHREATGRGQHVEISIMESLVALHQWTMTMLTHVGAVKKRAGNRHAESFHPLGPFRCKDGWVIPAVVTPEQWEGFCLAVGIPELINDDRFNTGGGRFDHADELDELIMPWFMQHNRNEIMAICQELRVPMGTVSGLSEILDDPQYEARDFWVDLEHPKAGALKYPGSPFKMAATPWVNGRAPLLGEHNEEVYGQRLGYSKEDLARLREMGAI